MKYCVKCGCEMEDSAVACPKCGNVTKVVQIFQQAEKSSGLGIASLVLAIIGFSTGVFGGYFLDVVAIILAVISLLVSIKKPSKRGVAIAGIIVAATSLFILCMIDYLDPLLFSFDF